jgi:hypothetical protein
MKRHTLNEVANAARAALLCEEMLLFTVATLLLIWRCPAQITPPQRNPSGNKFELSKRASPAFDAKSTPEKAAHFARQQRLMAEIERNRNRDKVARIALVDMLLCCATSFAGSTSARFS